MHGVFQIATARCVGAFNSDSYFFASAQPDCDQQSDGWMHAIRCDIQVPLFAPYRYDVGFETSEARMVLPRRRLHATNEKAGK